ncbi:MAG: hypoxanthine-guanine phosphoribosyltransferase [Salinisphaeraceae bacterium]
MTMHDERRRDAMAVRERADCVCDTTQLADIYDRMARDITEVLAEANPVILCVMLGGLVPTAEITRRLDFPFEFDYLHATRYHGETQGGELVWKVSPGIDLADRDVLVIDDILDEGTTLEAILGALAAQGARRVRTAILLEKSHARRDPALTVDFVGTTVPDRYVFGAGMDYKGYFRQLPAVYAVADT